MVFASSQIIYVILSVSVAAVGKFCSKLLFNDVSWYLIIYSIMENSSRVVDEMQPPVWLCIIKKTAGFRNISKRFYGEVCW